MNRQAWLMKAVDILRHDFWQIGETVPKNISVYPTWTNDNYPRDYLGVCIEHRLTGVYEIYIIPDIDNPLKALDVLVHELVHCVVGVRCGHDEQFQRVATAIGLDDDGLTAFAEEVLLGRLRGIREILGMYPEEEL